MKTRIFRLLFISITLILTALFVAGQARPVYCENEVDVVTTAILQRTNSGYWLEWIESLSGAQYVSINGQETIITSRYSPAMFDGYPNARAFEYVLEQVRSWYPSDQIDIHEYQTYFDGRNRIWKNLIVTIPGTVSPGEVVILSAHLDSVIYSDYSPYLTAPGAEDNGSGSAALLEAARLFRGYRFERTIKIIWFTGEEQGLRGSRAYVNERDIRGVVGVINLDMFGYDSDNDFCFELHVGNKESSQAIGEVFARAARKFSPSLTWDTIKYPMNYSDHASFLEKGIGAIEILENFHNDQIEGGCIGQDKNPHYHKYTDTTDKLNVESGFAIVRAALAAVIDLAKPVRACLENRPVILSISQHPLSLLVSWSQSPGADHYELYRSIVNCSEASEKIADLSHPQFLDGLFPDQQILYYQVVGIAQGGGCVSLPSECRSGVLATAPYHSFISQIWK